MEQIRQILAQLSLSLELNIAMCDMLEKQNKRLDAIEPLVKSHGTKIDALSTRVSELTYKMAGDAYNARTANKGNK